MTAALALPVPVSGYAYWQPVFAGLGIPTFPLGSDKAPLVKHYLKATLHSSAVFSRRFPDATAWGFSVEKAGLTVLDIDTTDEAFRDRLFERFGEPLAVVRTASGKWHGYYRNNGERRSIRPEGPSVPYDILGGGFVVAPFSQTPSGSYEFVKGGLETLGELTTMRAGVAPQRAAKALKEGDGRNNTLWRHCMAQARFCDDLETLLDVARSYTADNFAEAMADEEIQRVAMSAWRYERSGQNFLGRVGERQAVMTYGDVITTLAAADLNALGLYMILRQKHPDRSAPFMIADGLAGQAWAGNLSRRELRNARNVLVEVGVVRRIVGPSSRRGPALFSWKDGE